MNKIVKVIPVLLLPIAIGGCGPKASSTLPSEILFQYISIDVSQESVSYNLYYYSSNSVEVIEGKDENYAVLGKNLYPMDYDYDRTDASLILEQVAMSGDELGVAFERNSGENLLTEAVFSGFAQFVAPASGQTIDHSIEDIVVQWDSLAAERVSITLFGSCFYSETFEVPAGEMSYTIAANTLRRSSNSEQECEATITLNEEREYPVNAKFAGGEFFVTAHTEQTFQVTGLE